MAGGTRARGAGTGGAPTVYDVAARAGVSIATVSRVFRRPDEVSPATRRAVESAAHDLDYVPSGSARGLASRRSGAIGLCLPDLDGFDALGPVKISDGTVPVVRYPAGPPEVEGSLYTTEVLRGAGLEAWRSGSVLTVAVGRSTSSSALDDLVGRVDGLVTLSATVSDAALARAARRVPVVVVAGPRRGDDHDHVSSDNTAGMRALTEHLLDRHGCREFWFVGGPEASPDDHERFEGFRAALSGAGLVPPARPHARGTFTRRSGQDLGHRLLGGGPLPDAVVCSNDQTALGLLDVCAERGVRVPQDVRVTGFDGIDAASHARPRLTTVRQPMVELGRLAVDLLHGRLADPARPPATRVLAVEVAVQQSCGC